MTQQLVKDLQFYLGQFDLRLQNPEGLLLLLAIPVFFILGLWMGEELRWWRKAPIQLLRAGVVAALAVGLSQPVVVDKSDAPAVVLLADLSASVSAEAREEMETRIQDLWDEREEATTYLVGFGLFPELLAGPEDRRVSLPDDWVATGTDIAAALRFTYGLFPPKHDKKVVLLTDGEETRGDLLAEVMRAVDLNIQVSTVPILPAAMADVRVERLEAPSAVRPGEEATVGVEVHASARKRIRVRVALDGEKVAERSQVVPVGYSRVEIPVKLEGEGWHSLEVQLAARGDRYRQNNRASAKTWVFGKPSVLLVQRAREGANPLESLLKEQDMQLQVVTTEGIPGDLAALAKLDLIVLDDLKLVELSPEVAGRIRACVEEFGTGLLVSVGQDGAQLADPGEAPIEALLPVEFKQVKKKEEIPAALVFVTDRSSSMARGQKFVILLRAVVDTLGRLKDSAQVSMIMFDDFPEVVVPLTEARNREKIGKVLMGQRVGGGTSMYPALEAAHKQLKRSAAKLKHVIVLSDGQSISLYGHYGYIVEAMAKDEITVTTVALGSDADQEELKRIAARTSGRFYFTDSMENVPKIFTSETETITETNVVEQAVRAVPAKLVEALAGIDFEAAPPLKGYVASEARPTSEVLLVSSDRTEPLLVRWRFGLGRVSLMTTDAQGAWAVAWPGWDGFGKLWPRLVEDALRRSPPGNIHMAARVNGETGIVSVRVPAEKQTTDAEVPSLLVRSPSGKEDRVDLVRRGLGLYRAELDLEGLGAFALRAERRGRRGAREVAYGSVARSFEEEYLSAAGNPRLLEGVARVSGGLVDPAAEQLFAPGRLKRERTTSHWAEFLLLALGLFLAEVLIRRL